MDSPRNPHAVSGSAASVLAPNFYLLTSRFKLSKITPAAPLNDVPITPATAPGPGQFTQPLRPNLEVMLHCFHRLSTRSAIFSIRPSRSALLAVSPSAPLREVVLKMAGHGGTNGLNLNPV